MRKFLLGAMFAVAVACIFGGEVFADSGGDYGLNSLRNAYRDRVIPNKYAGEWNDDYFFGRISSILETYPNAALDSYDLANMEVTFYDKMCGRSPQEPGMNMGEYYCQDISEYLTTFRIEPTLINIPRLEESRALANSIENEFYLDDIDAFRFYSGLSRYYLYKAEDFINMGSSRFPDSLKTYLNSNNISLHAVKELNNYSSPESLDFDFNYMYAMKFGDVFIRSNIPVRVYGSRVLFVPSDTASDNASIELAIKKSLSDRGEYTFSSIKVDNTSRNITYCGNVNSACGRKIAAYDISSVTDSYKTNNAVNFGVVRDSSRGAIDEVTLISGNVDVSIPAVGYSSVSLSVQSNMMSESEIQDTIGAGNGSVFKISIRGKNAGDTNEYELRNLKWYRIGLPIAERQKNKVLYAYVGSSSSVSKRYAVTIDGDKAYFSIGSSFGNQNSTDVIYLADGDGCMNYGYISSGYTVNTTSTLVRCGDNYFFNNEPLSGFVAFGNQSHYFNPNTHTLATGFTKVDGNWYLFDRLDGSMLRSAFYSLRVGEASDAPKTIYLDNNGRMVYGFRCIGRDIFYFDPQSGAMQKGERIINGKTYHFDEETGALLRETSGWSGDSYIVDGEPVTGFQEIDGETYFFDPISKLAQRGQMKYGGYWYYFDSSTKAMAKSKFITLSRLETSDGPKTVYYDKDGHMLYGFRTIGNKRYYLKPGSGALQKGHMKVDGYWYMFDQSTGAMKRGEFYTMQKGESGDAPKTVYFNNDGHLLYGFQNIDGQTYYLKKGSGALQKGQQKIDGHWYYMDSNSGAVAKSKFVTLSKAETNDGPKTVYYDKNGYMLYGIRNIGGNIYYLKKGSGALQKGHMRVDGYWYFFDKNTGAAKKSTFYTLQPGESGDAPKTVYFDANGRLVYGMQYIDGRYYYFDKKNGRLLG